MEPVYMNDRYLDFQILLDENTLRSLENDLSFYGFKSFNDMVNIIIVNYYPSFFGKSKSMTERINGLFNDYGIDSLNQTSLQQQLLSIFIEGESTKK